MELKKNKKYELEPKRPLFFGIGMIIALSLTIVAFEWKSPISPVVEPPEPDQDIFIVLDETQITRQNLPDIPKPKPPVKKRDVVRIDQIEVAKDLVDVFEPTPIVDIDTEVGEVAISTLIKDEVPEEPFLIVESMPEFPGGDAALLQFLAKNIRYPGQAKRLGIEGKVHLRYVVDIDGSITDIEVMRGIGAGCDKEAIRVLKLLPKYSPGKQRGVPVEF